MQWWQTALYDTCSLITLDKLLLVQPGMARHFPATIMALEAAFSLDQLRTDTIERMQPRVTICPMPEPGELDRILAVAEIPKSLSTVDSLVYATLIHARKAVVTADKRLARMIQAKGHTVGNMAMILRDLVADKAITEAGCVKLLHELAKHNDLIIRGMMKPRWADLRDYTFPD